MALGGLKFVRPTSGEAYGSLASHPFQEPPAEPRGTQKNQRPRCSLVGAPTPTGNVLAGYGANLENL